MEVWNPFNPFRQISAKQRIKNMAHRINCEIISGKQKRNDAEKLYELEKGKPVYKTSIK